MPSFEVSVIAISIACNVHKCMYGVTTHKTNIVIHLFRIRPAGGGYIYEYGNAGVHKPCASGRHD